MAPRTPAFHLLGHAVDPVVSRCVSHRSSLVNITLLTRVDVSSREHGAESHFRTAISPLSLRGPETSRIC